jgi:hypothetical protein
MGNSFRIPKDGWEAALKHGGSTGLGLYAGLCRLSDDLGGKSGFTANLNLVAHASGLSNRTVSRYIPILVKARVIDFESGTQGEGFFTENFYRIL